MGNNRKGAVKMVLQTVLVFILIIASASAVIFGIVAGIRYLTGDHLSAEDEREYTVKKEELQRLKTCLNAEITLLNAEVENYPGGRYMSLVFTELDAVIYDTLYDVMSDAEADEEDRIPICGMLALSRDELPSAEGNITVLQFGELIASGWEACLYYDGTEELSAFLTDMGSILADMGIAMPSSMVFESETYSSEYDALLSEHGIFTAIHSGEEELYLIELSCPQPSSVWHPGYMGFIDSRGTNFKNAVRDTAGSAYGLFEIKFNDRNEDASSSYYSAPSRFANMIKVLRQEIRNGKMDISTVSPVRESIAQYTAERASLMETNDARIAELRAQIESIDSQLKELWIEYYGR